MVDNPITKTSDDTKIPKKKTVFERFGRICLEVLAPLIWVYVLVKLFVFDVDSWVLLNTAPNLAWLLNLKLFLFCLAAVLFWLIFGNKTMLKWLTFVIFYPFIVVIWKLPWFVFKQKSWSLGIAIVNTFISLLRSLKYSFISLSLFLASAAAIIVFDNKYILWIGTITLLILIICAYIRTFWFAIKPSSIFGIHVKFVKGVRKITPDSFSLDASIKNIPLTNLDEHQLSKWIEKLQTAVLFNRACLFIANKLREYQHSSWRVISPVFTILSLFVYSVVAFAGINYGLYRIDPSLFKVLEIPNVFTFVYFSFSNLIFNNIPELMVAKPLSQSVFMIEAFAAIVLIAIFVTLYFSVKNEKTSMELGQVITRIEEEGESMEGFIREEYKLDNITQALAELERLKGGMIKFLYLITKHLG